MYESFYGLSAKPFSLLPDADFLFYSKRHQRAITLLDYGILTLAGFLVITGEVGAGKTTIIRRYLKSVGDDVTVGLITNPSRTIGRLLDWITLAFDLDTNERDEAKLYHRFVDFLLQQYANGKRTVLIIDEAQNLGADQLEELRMLSNVNNEKDQMLQVVLVGQPELLEALKKPELRQFVQRIAVHCHLDPLTPAETAAYIRHRLGVVGGSPELFDDIACAAVHFFTGGVPRLINLLCDQAMVYSFSEDKTTVSAETVAEVAQDRGQSGLSAFRVLPDHWRMTRLVADVEPFLAAIREGK
ncbi:MAG TPA: general secretion pathway protein [Rhodospirillaceae bacterium]|nr:general secretion pathway protein [Rhodospirillaceae bacterium]